MASTNQITTKEFRNGVKIHTCTMTCAAGSAEFSDVNFSEQGKRLLGVVITTTGGATGPTDNSDLSITDGVSGVNLIATNGTDAVDNDAITQIAPDSATNLIFGPLVMSISNNAVNGARCTIDVMFTCDL